MEDVIHNKEKILKTFKKQINLKERKNHFYMEKVSLEKYKLF